MKVLRWSCLTFWIFDSLLSSDNESIKLQQTNKLSLNLFQIIWGEYLLSGNVPVFTLYEPFTILDGACPEYTRINRLNRVSLHSLSSVRCKYLDCGGWQDYYREPQAILCKIFNRNPSVEWYSSASIKHSITLPWENQFDKCSISQIHRENFEFKYSLFIHSLIRCKKSGVWIVKWVTLNQYLATRIL